MVQWIMESIIFVLAVILDLFLLHSHYYCEAGCHSLTCVTGRFYPNDRSWDGEDCGSSETTCCQRDLIPWFYRSLGYSTTDYIEMRICCDEGTNDEDVPIEQYEIYVK